MNQASIRTAFARLRSEGKRHRDIAEKLQISEAELLAVHVGVAAGQHPMQARRLQAAWPEIIGALEPLGRVMALTRNASCVHEKIGVYRNVSQYQEIGMVLAGEIDLRIFYRQWAYGFAVTEQSEQGMQHSLQFFDAAGNAIHKIFMRADSNLAAYHDVCEKFAAPLQDQVLEIATPGPKVPELADTQIDVQGFHRAWDAMRDTHEFFNLLKTFSLSRTQALRLAASKYVQPLETDCCYSLLEAAALEQVPIMVFTGNAGMLQIHSGPIKKFAVMGAWLNVLDQGFNLHLRQDHIASSWIVKKPTVDGLVTSLELFDAQGDTIAMFFGERKPGKPELCEWRALMDRLLEETATCAA